MTTFRLANHARLKPGPGAFTGGRVSETDLLTLTEAARLATKHAGEEVTPGDFLRAAARGEIRLLARCPRDATLLPTQPGDTQLQAVAGAFPDLPLQACIELANDGASAEWRAVEGFERCEAFGGQFARFDRWRLPDDELGFVVTVADCRVTGADLHALADAFKPRTEPAAATEEHKTPRADPLPGARFDGHKGGAANDTEKPFGFPGAGVRPGSIRRPNPEPWPAADWSLWTDMPKATLRAAVLLSVGLEPQPVSEKGSPAPELADPGAEFHRRLTLACAHLSDDGPLRPLQLAQLLGAPEAVQVSLPAFRAWADGMGWSMPKAFPGASEGAPAAKAARAQPALRAEPVAAVPVPAEARSEPARRKTWRDVAELYMLEVLRSGQFASAVEFERELRNRAGSQGSPFDKGTDRHRGTLWVREIDAPLSLKTIQNHWARLRGDATG